MTVTIHQDTNKHKVQSNEETPVPNIHVEPGEVRVTGRNEGVLPLQPVPVWDDCASLWRVEVYKERSLVVISIVAKGYRLCFMSLPLLLKAPCEIRSPKGPQKIQGM